MADEITKKILNTDSFKESLKTLSSLSEVCDKLDVSAITVMKRNRITITFNEDFW